MPRFLEAAQRLLPRDVFARLPQAARGAFRFTVPAEGTIPYAQAVELLMGMAEELANKPPPTREEADSTGLAGSTWGPTRSYLGLVAGEGADAVPPETHLQMARMLLLHHKQLGGRLQPVLKAIEQSIRGEAEQRGRTVGPSSGKGSLKVFSPEGELITKEGRYDWNNDDKKVQVRTGLDLHKSGFRLKEALDRAGLRNREHYVWKEEWVGSGQYERKILYIEVPPRYIDQVASAIQEAAPTLARALRANEGVWLSRAGETKEKIAVATPQYPQAPAQANEPATTPTIAEPKGLSPYSGSVQVPEAYRPLRWLWSDSNSSTVEISFPFMKGLERKIGSRTVSIPLASVLIEQSGTRYERGEPPDYFMKIAVADIPKLGKAMADDGRMPGTLAALRQLFPIWNNAVKEAKQAARQTVTENERRMALTLARRFSHMMGEGTQPEQVARQLEEFIPELRGIEPGSKGADLGVTGAWRVVVEKVVGKKAITRRSLLIRFANYTEAAEMAGYFGAGRPQRGDGGYWVDFQLKKAPSIARKLDETNLPLAMSIRIGVLTDSNIQGCYELEILSSAHDYSDIGNDQLRQQVEMIEQQIGLRATSKDSHGRTVISTPSPYQIIGIAFAHIAGGRVLIADAPGVGKTLQGIGYLTFTQDYPALVVCPASAVWNWVAELERWLPGIKVHVVDEDTVNVPRSLGIGDVVVLSERRMVMVQEALKSRGFKLVIFDEAHYFKHPTAERSKVAATLSGLIPHVLLLSGTAMENKLGDLWHLLYMIDPVQFPSKKDFTAKYATQNKRSVTATDPETGEEYIQEFEDDRATNSLDELRDVLRCIMVRRLKSEVLTDLPNKYRKIVKLNDLDLRAYHKAEAEMSELLVSMAKEDRLLRAAKRVLNGDNIDLVVEEINQEEFENPVRYIIVVLNRLRQLAGEAKAGAAAAWAVDFVQRARRPLVVFVEHPNVGVVIKNALEKVGIRSAYIGGTVPSKVRFEYVKDFQDGRIDVLICSKAAREAITLTRASEMLFVEWWWVPSWMEQAEDREYRRGQTNDVTIYYLEAPHTTDGYIREMIETKRADIERVMRLDDYDESEEAAKIEAPITEIMANEMLNRISADLASAAEDGLEITVPEVEEKMDELVAGKGKRKRRK